MSIDEHRMLTNLLDAFDRLHDGMIEVADLAALMFATSRALDTWPHVEELAATEKEVRHIAQFQLPEDERRRRALALLPALREHLGSAVQAAGRKPRHHPRLDG